MSEMMEALAMYREGSTGNWRQIKRKARAKWQLLSDEDLDQVAGRREDLIRKVQQRYNKPRDEAEKEVFEWYRTV